MGLIGGLQSFSLLCSGRERQEPFQMIPGGLGIRENGAFQTLSQDFIFRISKEFLCELVKKINLSVDIPSHDDAVAIFHL